MATPNYRTAPLKAVSRQIVFEICRRLVVFGPLRDYAYIGLGGVEFVDFEKAYEALGIETMVSIENKESLERLEFNRPYEQIRLLSGSTNRRLPEIDEIKDRQCIVWLDYVDSFNADAMQDLHYLGDYLKPGSAVFVTYNAHYDTNNWSLDKVRSNFGDYFDSTLRESDFVNQGLANRQLLASEQVLARAFASRIDSICATRVLDLRYKDSSRMQVAGWVVAERGDLVDSRCRFAELAFTPAARAGKEIILSMPRLTSREWAFLERQLPQADVAGLRAPHRSVSKEMMEQFLGVHRYARAV